MLSLTRRVGEEIVIGDPRHPLGVIRVVDVHGDKVRLSFDFPRDTAINRRELADQKAKQLDIDAQGGGGKPGTPGTPGTPGAPGSGGVPGTTPAPPSNGGAAAGPSTPADPAAPR